jgi:hypothetical protein
MLPARLLLLFPAALSLFGQYSGRMAGTVLDASGSPVSGAAVSLYLPNGNKPLLTTKTVTDGAWRLIGVRPSDYDLTFEATGFAKSTLRGIPVDPARETSVQTIALQLPTVTQSVDVTTDGQSVQILNAEIASTITAKQMEKLPALDRDPLALIQNLAGVTNNGNSATTINGLRTSYSNMTLDGINIQDNYLRDNGLDYNPNRLLIGQVRQMTLATSNGNAAASGGATQLVFETPSGTNQMHGSAYWYNRNSRFAANDWFNNQSGVARPRLNQNQAGASVGGPIVKDKLFFYANYEAVRTNQQQTSTATVLTDDARNGIFTYTVRGVANKVNLLNKRGIATDTYIQNLLKSVPAASAINAFSVGDSTPTILKNTAGYRFNQRSNERRDNITARGDYNLSAKHVFSTSYVWNRDNTDRPDLETDFSVIPRITNPNHSHFLSANWRWTPTATLTNELRGGFNLAPGDFPTSQEFGKYLVTGTLFTDPVTETLPQGRATNTYALSDNAALQHSRHFIQFGFHMQQIRVHAYDDAGILPADSLGMGTGQHAFVRSDFTGIGSSDLATANALLATLGGFIDGYSQTFNVTSRTSGYQAGAGTVRNLKLSEYDIYVQDNWRLLPRVMVNVGLRWNLPGVVDERDSLELLPVLRNGDARQTLLSNATLSFAGASAGRPWHKRDLTAFAPNVGLAWDVFGAGRTAVRAGYSISYVNDQAISAPQSIAEANSGLVGLSTATGLSGRVSTGLPAIAPPVYKVPLTVADNYSGNPFNTVGLISPDLKTPYVQQYSAGIQHEVLHTVFEARYVGNHVVKAYRAFDYNQVVIKDNGFLTDFLTAQNNGNLALAKNGSFLAAYNATIPGSKPLPVFAQLRSGGQLANGTIRNLIQTGQAGQLAANYQENHNNGSVQLFPNPYALGANILNNYSNSSYHSMQLEARHRSQGGFEFSANYTWSKVLSDAAGDSQNRIEQFLDINNPRLERARANFDLRHAVKGTAVYDLPFGKGRFAVPFRALNKTVEGWSLGGIAGFQSGAPFSILSGYGTLNRADGYRSYYNTANTSLTMPQLASVVRYEMTGNGPYVVAQSAINQNDGSGTNAVGEAAFQGQIFSNPGAGTLGTLQRRSFSGPGSFDVDLSVQRNFSITERQSVEVRMEGVNILNHPSFYSGEQNINSATFGVLGSTFNPARVMQFAARYRF